MAIRETSRIQMTRLYVVPETTPGTIAYPSSSHGVLSVGRPTFTAQVGELENTGWLLGTRTKQPGCTKNFKAEAFNLSVYATRCVTPGTVTNEHNVLEGAFGVATVTPGTSVEYDPAFNRKTYSIFIHHEHTMFVLTQCVFTGWKLKIAPSDTCKFQVDANGLYARMHVVGSAALTGAATAGTTSLIVGTTNIERYLGYGLVYLEDAAGAVTDDNAGAGYQITAIDYSTGTITINTGTGTSFAIGDHVKPFAPSFTPNSSPIDAKQIEALSGGNPFDVYSIELSATENVVFAKQLTEYPTRFDEDKERDISVTLMGLMTPENVRYFKAINQQSILTVQSKAAVAAGNKIQINMYDVRISSVQPGEEGPTMNVTMSGSLRGADNDEFMIKFY